MDFLMLMSLRAVIIYLCLTPSNIQISQAVSSKITERESTYDNIVLNKRSANEESNDATNTTKAVEEEEAIPYAGNAVLRSLEPTVRLSAQRYEGPEGSRYTVTCYGNSKFLSWLDPAFKNISAVTSGPVKVELNRFHNTSDLVFSSISSSQSGRYRCENNYLGRKATVEFVLSIQSPRPVPFVPPPVPTVTLSTQHHDGLVGGRYSARCSGNSPNLTWVNSNNQNLSSIRINAISVTLDRSKNISDLTFNPIQTNHAGIYTCINNIQGRSMDHQFRLVVNIPPLKPNVKLSKTKHEGLISSFTSVQCSGNSPNLTWTDRYNRDLSLFPAPFTRVIPNRIHNTSELIFDNLTKDHGGIYSCTNTIDKMADTARFELVVTVPKPTVSLTVGNRIKKYPTQPLSVICSGNSQNITWKNPTNGIIFQRTPGSSQDPHTIVGSQQVELKFDSIQMYYTGRYICSVSLSGLVESKEFHLEVQEVPKLELVPSADIITLDTKSSYKVECKSKHISNIHWIGPNNQEVSTGSDRVHQKYTSDGRELKITKASRQIEGIYTCKGNADGIPLYRTFAVTVTKRQYLSDPSFGSFQSNIMTKKVGDSFSVTCEGDTNQLYWRGPPTSQIIPVDPMNRIFSSEVKHVDEDDYTNKLEGRSLQLSDAGSYVCEVIDGSQLKNRSLSLVVIEPTSFVPGLQSYYQVNMGETVVLECGARGYPQPTVEWYKQNGTSRLSFDGITYSTTEDKLILSKANLKYVGNYTCYAKQEVMDGGYGYRTVSLNVNHKPFFRIGERYVNLYTYLGRPMNITCNDISYPPASHKWTKNHRTWEDLKTIRLAFDNEDDFGEYTCEAYNSYGSEVQYITAIKGEKPEIPELKISMVSGLDVHYKITCHTKSVTHFILDYKPLDYDGMFYQVKVQKDNTKRHVLHLVNPKTKYVFRASSVNNVEQSPYSKNETITTGNGSIVIYPSITLQLTLLTFTIVLSRQLYG